MKYSIRALSVLAIVGLAFASQGGPSEAIQIPPKADQELLTSTPGVTYVLKLDGSVEFHVPADFQGVAITQDGRNLYLAN